MQEIWLKANWRVLLLGMIPPIVLVAVGLIPLVAVAEVEPWIRYAGWGAVVAGLFLLAMIAFQMRVPRLAYADGQLLVYLVGGRPLRVPIEIVQCFFLASGGGQIPGPKGRRIGVRNLTMRLDEKATDYHHRNVKPALGRWDDGYIVIHGAWCEPLDLALVGRLNGRLAEAQSSRKSVAGEQQAGQTVQGA
jgi:hypothetical protein